MTAYPGLLRAGDPGYGHICDCGNLKNRQSQRCIDCQREHVRGDDYWQRRTCSCGGPKDRQAPHCIRCEHECRRGRNAA